MKLFDFLLNVYALAWVLITRTAAGMYTCVALAALTLGLFVISLAEELRLAKKAKEPLPEAVEEAPIIVDEKEDEDYETILANHRQNAERFEEPPPVTAVYQPPAEGTLREENREDGWRHVFVWSAGEWAKSHRISPGGVKGGAILRAKAHHGQDNALQVHSDISGLSGCAGV